MLPGADSGELALNAFLFEEFLAREHDGGTAQARTQAAAAEESAAARPLPPEGVRRDAARCSSVLALVPGLKVETIESSCCGMAGSFGYEAEHYDVSMKMAEAVAAARGAQGAAPTTLIVADGTSCRHQIHDGAGRAAVHVARVLEQALAGKA